MTDNVFNWSSNTAEEFKKIISGKVNEVRNKKVNKWLWVNSSDEERNARIEALFKDMKIDTRKIKNFEINFVSQALDFADPTRKVLKGFLTETICFDMSDIDPKDFVVEFLAYLRLHNRSEKRCLKNNATCTDTIWKISNSVEIKLSNANCWWSGCTNEIVEFREDVNLSYSKIMTLTEQVLQTKILESCHMNIKTSEESLTSETASLWYLLFGCEAIKNPSAIVHHAMFIDLVRAGKYTWKSLGSDAPMASKKSIQPAMRLNSDYAKYMPVAYTYQPVSNYEEGELRQRESKLMKEWLQLKLGEKGTTALLALCKKDLQAVDVLWSLIQNSFESWGMPMAVLQEQTNLLGV